MIIGTKEGDLAGSASIRSPARARNALIWGGGVAGWSRRGFRRLGSWRRCWAQAAGAQGCQHTACEGDGPMTGRWERVAVLAGGPGGLGHPGTFGLPVHVGDPGLRGFVAHDGVHSDLLLGGTWSPSGQLWPDGGGDSSKTDGSGPVQAAVLTLRRRAIHDRSASTASAAASSAAVTAIRVICQPGVPPITAVWTGTGSGSWCTGWWMCPGGRWWSWNQRSVWFIAALLWMPVVWLAASVGRTARRPLSDILHMPSSPAPG